MPLVLMAFSGHDADAQSVPLADGLWDREGERPLFVRFALQQLRTGLRIKDDDRTLLYRRIPAERTFHTHGPPFQPGEDIDPMRLRDIDTGKEQHQAQAPRTDPCMNVHQKFLCGLRLPPSGRKETLTRRRSR